MIITAAKIEQFNPCKNKIDNFKNRNPGFKGNVTDFLSLENITYDDKLWVCTRLVTRNQKFRFAVACAESVLYIFESKLPGDTRVRDLIDFMNTISNVETMSDDTRSKLLELRHAAYDAYAYAAIYAADAAHAYTVAYACACAADTDAAAYAAAVYACADADVFACADATVYAAGAYAADDSRENQQNLNLILLADIMECVK